VVVVPHHYHSGSRRRTTTTSGSTKSFMVPTISVASKAAAASASPRKKEHTEKGKGGACMAMCSLSDASFPTRPTPSWAPDYHCPFVMSLVIVRPFPFQPLPLVWAPLGLSTVVATALGVVGSSRLAVALDVEPTNKSSPTMMLCALMPSSARTRT
jgi:hypothetical protein